MAGITDSDAKRYDRFRESFSRRVVEWQKTVASLATFATALLALPILFFKDIFHEAIGTGETIVELIYRQQLLVQWSIYVAWALLACVVGSSLWFNVLVGQYMHGLYKYDYPPDFVDAPEGGTAEKRLRTWFMSIGGCFALGFAAMMFFALFYVRTTAEAKGAN